MLLFVQTNKGLGSGFTKHKTGGVNTVGLAGTGVNLQGRGSRFVSRWGRSQVIRQGSQKQSLFDWMIQQSYNHTGKKVKYIYATKLLLYQISVPVVKLYLTQKHLFCH